MSKANTVFNYNKVKVHISRHIEQFNNFDNQLVNQAIILF